MNMRDNVIAKVMYDIYLLYTFIVCASEEQSVNESCFTYLYLIMYINIYICTAEYTHQDTINFTLFCFISPSVSGVLHIGFCSTMRPKYSD